MIPARIDAAPRVGPTTLSCSMTTVVSILPEFNTFARSLASPGVKLPEIWLLPPVISVFTFGAEYTTPSSTIANGRPIFSLVRRAHF